MTRLQPLRALRYTPVAGDPARLLAPPYDVIGAREADRLRRRDSHNAVHLVLPEGDVAQRYRLAADRLDAWIRDGILAEDELRGIYVYRQQFEFEGSPLLRWSAFVALGLSPPGAGQVLPHEETHAGPKQDRLALTIATRVQLSAVFLTRADPGSRLLNALRRTASAEPVLETRTPDRIGHTLWRIGHQEATDLLKIAGSGPLLIADGHHRYETALSVLERLPESAAARQVLACIASEADPGLRVFPTHRAVRGTPPGGSWREALAGFFELLPATPRQISPARLGALVAERAASGFGASLGAVLPARREAFLLAPRATGLEAAGVEADEARIASVVFDRLVLAGALGRTAESAAHGGRLTYHREAEAAVQAAAHDGAAFLLPPVEVEDVRRVAASGRRLPPKSTYFAPKIPCGLLFRRI